MSIELNPIANPEKIGGFNTNFQLIEDELNENVLRRQGLSPGEANHMEVSLDMNSNSILNVSTDTSDPGSLLSLGDADTRFVFVSGDTMTGNLSMGGFGVTNLRTPTSSSEATRKDYVDSGLAGKVSKSGDSMSGDLNMVQNDINNIGTTRTGNLILNGVQVNPNELDESGVIWVKTLADLQALPTGGLVDGQASTTLDGGDFYWDAMAQEWQPDTDKYPSVVSGAPYVSMKEKLKKSTLNLVVDFRAPDDGAGDASEAMKEFLDFGNKRLDVPPGIFNFANPVVVHDQSGLDIRGASQELTVFTASSDLLLDTSELSSLPISYQSEYNKRAIFHVTAYDGENGRVDKAARNTFLRDILVDFSDTPAERVASLLSSPQFSWAEFHNIRLLKALSLAEFWITSGEDSRFYHLLFNSVRTSDCVHHIKNDDYLSSSLVQQGTTWRVLNNAISRNDYGYQVNGINYATLADCSVDNQKKGAYGYDIYSCLGFNLITPAVETRYEHAGTGYGGGILRVREGSTGNIHAGFLVGGDRDELGNGSVSDFGVSAMTLFSDSTVTWRNPQMDVPVDSTAARYPITVSGGFLDFTQGNNSFGGGSSDFSLSGSARVKTVDRFGNEEFFAGGGAGSSSATSQGLIDITFDEDVFVGTTTSLDTASTNMVYRVNQTGTGTSFGHPRDTNLFGVLEVKRAGIYVKQDISYNNGVSYRRNSADGGGSWNAWVKLSP